MKDNRPVNLDISTIKLPVTAIVSILHRVSGVAAFAGIAVLLWLLDRSLTSAASFADLQADLDAWWVKLILWAALAALAYHLVAGVRHLLMDTGIGESLEGGRLGAWITLVLSAVLILLAGVWVW